LEDVSTVTSAQEAPEDHPEEKDYFDMLVGLVNFNFDESTADDEGITCNLLDDVSVMTFDQEASEDEEGGADYFDLLVGLANLDEMLVC
jgi:hypothetical protein